MKWMERLNENIKKTVRSWLNVLPANHFNFQINEMMDFEGHAILNRIWYRGDGNELEQIYQQNAELQTDTSSGQADQPLEWTCGKFILVSRG